MADGKRWRTKGDGNVCSACAALDNMLVWAWEPFCFYEGAYVYGPPLHGDCRCQVFEEDIPGPEPEPPPPPDVVYTCLLCGAEFATLDELEQHILEEHDPVPPPPPPEVYTCSYCGAEFASQGELDEHIRAVHDP